MTEIGIENTIKEKAERENKNYCSYFTSVFTDHCYSYSENFYIID